MKGLKILNSIVNVLLIGLFCLMLFVVITSKASGGEPNILGYELKMVLSGSMEPTFKTGSIIAVDADFNTNELKVDDVITFMKDEYSLITHRIVEVIETDSGTVFRTKGDNNDYADLEPVLDQNVVGQYTGFTIPYVGYLMNFANSKMGILSLLILPGVILLSYAIISIYQAVRFLDRKQEQSPENTSKLT